MRVSIGVLAHNEEQNIARMLESTLGQTIFRASCSICLEAVSIVVVANGCTDNTCSVASRVFSKRNLERNDVALSVHALERGDKANAWNEFVHELSPRDADVLILLDADIEFASQTVLEVLLSSLESNQHAHVATDVPTARIRRRAGLLGVIASKVGTMTGDTANQHAIAGSCYASRAGVLRSIMIPPGLPVEDGFVRACIVTGGFTHPDEPTLVRVEKTVQHYYDPATTLRAILRHQVRLTAGSLVNSVLFDILWREAPRADSLADVVRQHLETDPNWVSAVMRDYAQKRGQWLIPNRIVFRRIRRIRNLPFASRIIRWPFAIATTVVDLVVCWRANTLLRKGEAVNFW